jgi:23S rRNA pseudouridine1911/1915/1917 synthase
MPSKNMLPKGQRRKSVKAEYRAARTLAQEQGLEVAQVTGRGAINTKMIDTDTLANREMSIEERIARNYWITTRGADGSKVAEETQEPRRYENPYAELTHPPVSEREIQVLDDLEPEDGVRSFIAEAAASGMRIDAYLAKAIPDISRGRVQLLIENGQVTVDGVAAKAKQKLKGGEAIEIEGEPQLQPLHAEPEDIPLDIVYEDDDLAVVNKAAGMMVHAGSGTTEHNRGTLVNALLYHFKNLSEVGGDLRPGIVHRLDKQTSGLIVVAKNDSTHRKLGEMFSERKLRKVYLALVIGWMDEDGGTVTLPISRDVIRRTRMTTRRQGGRSAVTNWRVLEKIDGPYGKFSLLEVHIETGRTHQIRVHMQALGHPVVGDNLYGAPHRILLKNVEKRAAHSEAIEMERNFLHAAELEFTHPRTKQKVALKAALPEELQAVFERLK